MEALQELGRHVVDPVDDRRRPLVGRPGLALLGLGEGHGAQGQDLVDLGGVEQVARALGGDGRVVVEDDRRGQHGVAPALVADQHRPGVEVAAGLGGRLGPLRRVEQGQEHPLVDPEQAVGRDQRVPQGHAPVGGRVVPGAGVLQPEAQPDQAVGPLQALGRQPDRAQDRPAVAHCPPGQPAGHGVDGLDPATPRALERRGQLAGQQPGQRDLDGHLLLGGLVPGDQLGAVDRQAGDLVEGPGLDVDRLDRLGLHVQEPDQHPDHGGVLGLEQALGLGRPGLVGAALAPQPGHQHPELPAGLVLGRRGPVGIQQVALVEDGVGHLAGQLEGREGRAHCLASPASLNSASRASSQVGRARTALKRCSESSVSRRTRIQPPPGKKRSMISRHTATGSR